MLAPAQSQQVTRGGLAGHTGRGDFTAHLPQRGGRGRAVSGGDGLQPVDPPFYRTYRVRNRFKNSSVCLFSHLVVPACREQQWDR